MYKFFKRAFDILFSLFAMIFLGLIFIVVAPIIKIEDKGPVFYTAERLGRKGKIFKMYKFRSMYVNSPDLRNKDGSTFNSDHDPRVTKIGRILRKTSLDEFPQFVNVLKGDMSFIGPRAFVATYYQGYDSLDEMRKKRLEVRPGVTGYSQAYYRNSITKDEKIKYDVYYVENLSFLLDLKVFFKTITSVLKHENVFVENTEDKDKTENTDSTVQTAENAEQTETTEKAKEETE